MDCTTEILFKISDMCIACTLISKKPCKHFYGAVKPYNRAY